MKRSPMRAKRSTPRRRSAPRWSTPEWAAATDALLRRSGERCEMCGEPLRGRAERAHRIRRRDGGDRLANLLLLHPACHAWTHANPEAATARGLIVHALSDVDVASVPVRLGTRGLVLLDDDGGWERVSTG